MWTLLPSEGPATWPEELSEGKHIAINEENGCAPKTKMSHFEKLHSKGTLKYLMTLKAPKIKYWKLTQIQRRI